MEQDPPNPPSDDAGWLAQSLYARRGVLISLAILAGLALATRAAWQAFGPSVAQSTRYRVTSHSVAITPPPEWVRDDPVQAAFSAPGVAEGLSILDPPERLDGPLTGAIESHPWVRRVTSLTKLPPNRVNVLVEYRRPIAAVITERGLTPTDVDGAALPARDLSRPYLAALPRVGVASGDPHRPAPHAVSGSAWPAEAVAGAAAIVEAFGEHFQKLSLIETQIDPTPDFSAGQRFVTYRLRSTGNTLVIWGAAPGHGPPDEAPFATKLARLREAIERYGPIASVNRRMDVIDVRRDVDVFRRVVLREKNRLAAKPEGDDGDEPITK